MNLVKYYEPAGNRAEERMVVRLGDAWYQLRWHGGVRRLRWQREGSRYETWWQNERLSLTCGRRVSTRRGARMRVVGRTLATVNVRRTPGLHAADALADFAGFLARLGIGTEEE